MPSMYFLLIGILIHILILSLYMNVCLIFSWRVYMSLIVLETTKLLALMLKDKAMTLRIKTAISLNLDNFSFGKSVFAICS